jgi:antitoxin YefM
MTFEIVTFTDARKRLADVMDRVHDGQAPVIVTRQNAEPTVMISLAEFNRMTETMHLLENKTNAARIAASIASLDAGKGVAFSFDEE